MIKLFIATIALLLALPAYASGPIRIIEGMVSKVVDGDTIQVTDNVGTIVKVRLYGIDAPETEKRNKKTGRISKTGQPYGEEAFQALQSKLMRQRVKLDVINIDRYKRLVALVELDGKMINEEMVAEGWAWAYRDYLNREYASEFIDLEERARKQHLGLWKQSNPEPPWEFRKLQKQKQKRKKPKYW